MCFINKPSIYFDTSAIIALYENQNQKLIEELKQKYIVILSILNILEIAIYRNREKRIDTIHFCDNLNTKDYYPLDYPENLLKRSFIHYLDTKEIFRNWSVQGADKKILGYIKNPGFIDNGYIAGDEQFLAVKKEAFKISGKEVRDEAKSKKLNLSESIFCNPTNFLDAILSRNEILDKFFKSTIQAYGFKTEKNINGYFIIKKIEPWFYYFSAYYLGIYNLSVKKTNYSQEKNPGYIDISQSVYLSACDFFITNDKPFFELLRNILSSKYKIRNIRLFLLDELIKDL